MSPVLSSELSGQILVLQQGEKPCLHYQGDPAEQSRALADSKLLQVISAEMISEQDVEALYEKLVDAAVTIMRSDFASMQMHYAERGSGGELRLLAFRGFTPHAAEFWGWVQAKSASTCGEALRTRRRVIVSDVEKCDFLAGTDDLATYRETSIRAVQSTPLLSRNGKLVGMISTHWRNPHEPTERDLRLLDILARQAADLIERMHAEEALREMEERFRSILNNAPAVIFIKDIEGRYLQVNQSFEKLVHFSQQELVGKTGFDLFPEEIARKFRENDLAVIRTGKPLEVEEVLPHDDGLRTYFSTKFPLRREDGSIYAVAGISTDITERKRSEVTALRLAAIVESSDDAIVGKDLNGIISSWNKGAERIYGYAADEVIGKPVTILMPPDRVNDEPGILERIRRGERIDHYETVRRRKDGRLVDISLTISPVKDSAGRIIGASKVACDITERKRIEREQQALYDLVAAINQTTSLPEICQAALDAVQRCLDADRASILMYDNDGVMRFKAWRGLSEEYRRAVEGHSPWNRDDPNPQPVCIDDVEQVPIEAHLRDMIEWEGIRALAFIPIRYEKRLVGKFMVYYSTPHRFTREEIRPAETIATQIAFAIDRRRSGEALERLVQQRTASLREAIAQMEEFSYSVSHDLRARSGPCRDMPNRCWRITEPVLMTPAEIIWTVSCAVAREWIG